MFPADVSSLKSRENSLVFLRLSYCGWAASWTVVAIRPMETPGKVSLC